MITIPSLNCPNRECVHKKVGVLKDIMVPWVHVDVADGVFAPVVLFEDTHDFTDVASEKGFSPHIEVHLMVMNPEPYVREWLAAGAKRIIVHAESIDTVESLKRLEAMCGMHDAELGLAVKATTDKESLESFIGNVNFWTVLAVPPGFSGGIFEKDDALDMISFLKERMQGCVVEVDGGMDDANGKYVKEGGADIIVSGSFIFGSVDPKQAYDTLLNV